MSVTMTDGLLFIGTSPPPSTDVCETSCELALCPLSDGPARRGV
jgi:hypothetical protein